MDSFNFWLGHDSIPTDTTIKWGFDSSAPTSGSYHYSPSFTSTGSNTDETADSAALDLSTFTLCAWFRSVNAPSPDEGFLVNKGGTGSEAAGENLNYGLWMTNTGTIRGGFETGAGVDNLVTSPLAYDDGNWHFALIYYSGTSLQLFVDDMETAVATLATTSTPETNAKPVRINKNSRANDGFMPSGAEIDEVRVWSRALTDEDERTALMENGTVNETGLVLDKDFGDFDYNLTAQVIADGYTAPVGVTWHSAGAEPATPNIGRLRHGTAVPIWIWWHVDANAITRKDDAATFNFSFLVAGGGTGDPGTGGGTGGGGVTFDEFGIRQIYATKSGGRTYVSNWHESGTTTHSWDGTSGQDYGNFDPQDDMADLVCPATCRATVDATQDVLIATTNSDKNSWRYYIKDPLDDNTSSTWKWSESTEITVYYKAISDYSGGSIHVHARIMGPTEHWLAINTCGGAGHEYSYEIKKNLVNQFRKEEFHVEPDSGYCDNIEFPDESAPYNQWIGMKLVTKLVNATTMKIEAWKDLTDGANGGTWIKAGEMTDDGTNWKLQSQDDVDIYTGLAAGSGNCAKIPTLDQALTMDCSAVGLRVDNTLVHFKKFSVREIEPTDAGQGGSGGSSGGGGTGGGTGGNPPPTNADYKIAFCGDWGCENATDRVLDLIDEQGYDFVMGLGDNAYASAKCWTDRFKPLKDTGNFNSCYGNHEYSESGKETPYKTFFGHSKTYFTFKKFNVQFFVIDTNINVDPGSTQHNEVKAWLEASHSDATVKWRIAVMHHQWFGGPSSHSHNEFDQVQAFHQLFINHGVSFVTVGHLHNWQRSYQVAYNASDPENPTKLNTSSPYSASAPGLMLIISGAGGHDSGSSLYGIGTQPSFTAFQNRTHNGIWEVIASNNGLTWNCAFVEVGGEKLDEFVITTS